MHIRAVQSGSILLADQVQILILISPKLVMDSSKKWKVEKSIKKYSRLRVNNILWFNYVKRKIRYTLEEMTLGKNHREINNSYTPLR